MDDQMRQRIRNCVDCHSVCVQTIMDCLGLGGRHAEAAHIQLLLDCSEICQTSANFMMRDSPRHTRTCAVCAEICEQCAHDCEQFGDDARMKACAETCRHCAESCRQMAGVAA